MAASGSSSSSFTSSSRGYPTSYAHTHGSPDDNSTWTPSNLSAATSNSSVAPTPLRPLDLGPPGYQATITLFERTTNETTVYLGPWNVVTSDSRRVRWQCSYQGEVLEHFLPSNVPADTHPHTLHSRHRPYGDPCDMELYVTFREPHRIRYVMGDGTVVHDEVIEVKYEFTSCEGSHRFQGDLRNQDLIDHFDVDVVWSDRDGRTDSFGSVRGLGAIQRMKMWRDRYTTYHYITFYANRVGRRYREYLVYAFDAEIRNREDSNRRLRLYAQGRRGSAPESSSSGAGSSSSGRRSSVFSLRHGRGSSGSSSRSSRSSHSRSGHNSSSASSSAANSPGSGLDIRYLGIQFSRNEDYRRFMEQWEIGYTADAEFQGVPFPSDRFELPSPEIYPTTSAELQGDESYHESYHESYNNEGYGGLETVTEPYDEHAESDDTP